MVLILAYIGAYLIGAVPFGYLVARARGVDITATGSGNIGATNVARVLGRELGILVFLLDVLKGALPPMLAPIVLAGQPLGVLGLRDHALLLGATAIVGHSLSPFIGFKGGKGVATGFGSLLGLAPLVGLGGFGMFLLSFAFTRIVSLSSLVGSGSVLVLAVLTRQTPLFLAVYTVLVAYVWWKHKANIGRLLRGEEPKLDMKNAGKSESSAETNGKPAEAPAIEETEGLPVEKG
ncbi:MAG: glycerol-3-phosphate 1-O-acyltransferase PlsY [Fimbriimonadaceae bacterium]|nr:glycerol-3-phosphate 1-O-acyltransferase PlsY [Fimbriimonadaceae bacterium]QYK57021.1 MAG: glycerol-3-phosphate 1-O-acyltransferase PlsY [Fimbriimonadaceae bacterium]